MGKFHELSLAALVGADAEENLKDRELVLFLKRSFAEGYRIAAQDGRVKMPYEVYLALTSGKSQQSEDSDSVVIGGLRLNKKK